MRVTCSSKTAFEKMPHQCPPVCVRFAPSPAEPPEVFQHNVDVAVCIFGDDRRGNGAWRLDRPLMRFNESKRPRPPVGLDWGLKSVGQNRLIAKFTNGLDTKKNASRRLHFDWQAAFRNCALS